MKKSRLILTEEILHHHTEKITYWFNLLNEIMPEYFFQTFTSQQIEEILPALFNIERQKGIQQITSEESIILIYLKDENYNLITTSRLMRSYNIVGAVIHKSLQQIVINGIPRTLVIEYYKTNNPLIRKAAIFSWQEVQKAYKKRYKHIPEELEDLYNRINWNAVDDLTMERLVERLRKALQVQGEDALQVDIEKAGGHEARITISMTNCPKKNFYHKIIETLALNGFEVSRLYFRELTLQEDENNLTHMPVSMITVYINIPYLSLNSPKLIRMLTDLKHVNWIETEDLIHNELVRKKGWSLNSANLIRAAAEFIHSQFSYIDRNAYNSTDILRLMLINEPLLKKLFSLFEMKFDKKVKTTEHKRDILKKRILKDIDHINTGMKEKDDITKNILRAIYDFILNICKTNYYVADKSALSFRINPAFMNFYSDISDEYRKAFPVERPFGIFYFYKKSCIGFHVRFADIARGGWRTVIPKIANRELERMDAYEYAKDEVYREVYVLAHTQHMKNKDIYEGGSKMICLVETDSEISLPELFMHQRSIARAFMDLINYDPVKKILKSHEVKDLYGKVEIIEIGPDENMFDPMIDWLNHYAERSGYILGGGLISGKPETGINHKEYGVTSFGVHQYLLKVLHELNINPQKDAFSVKISGGPFGDVAGNELALLLKKDENGKYLYPKLKITAITDGPAAVWDPDGIDKQELISLIKKDNLDKFSPDKLHGIGAYIIYTASCPKDGIDMHRLITRTKQGLTEKWINRDDFMEIFQNNLLRHYADIFIPCGGRPATISLSNWEKYLSEGKPSSRAIIEGANSFITPEARIKLQEHGVWIIKDASANKCGVITSSYEILSGLLLGQEGFVKIKDELVKEIMEILRERAQREANYLFFRFKESNQFLTEITEELSRDINRKTAEIAAFIEKRPEFIKDRVIIEHLPVYFHKCNKTILRKLPEAYKKAIVSTELACRIVYSQAAGIEQEIKAVI